MELDDDHAFGNGAHLSDSGAPASEAPKAAGKKNEKSDEMCEFCGSRPKSVKQIHRDCCASDIMSAYRNARDQPAAAGKAFSVLRRKGGALWKEVMQKFKSSHGPVGRSKSWKPLH